MFSFGFGLFFLMELDLNCMKNQSKGGMLHASFA